MRTSLLTSAVLSFWSIASCASVSPRASSDTFGLFAYGDGIGGFPITYENGDAFIARQESTNSSFSVPIFTANASTTWVANPNTTDTGPNSTFSNAVFFVPGPDSSSRQVGFLASNSTPTDDVTSGFTFYGHVAILVDSAGAWQTLFYAIPTSSNGIWSLNWNTTDEDDAIPVTLKDSAPPHIPPAANATP